MGTQGNNQKYYDSTGGSGVMVFLPVLKNTTITVVYGEVTIKAFRFFYAQGEEL